VAGRGLRSEQMRGIGASGLDATGSGSCTAEKACEESRPAGKTASKRRYAERCWGRAGDWRAGRSVGLARTVERATQRAVERWMDARWVGLRGNAIRDSVG
jgi:hypothetical protein